MKFGSLYKHQNDAILEDLLPNPPFPNCSNYRLSHHRPFHFNGSHNSTSSSSNNGSKSIKFLKKTLSFTDTSSMFSTEVVPKGFLAMRVGKELKRFIIPTEYLSHQAFGQEGVLKIPCEVVVFERILKVVEEKRDVFFLHEFGLNAEKEMIGCCSSSDCELTPSHHPQMCR
ncbi:hypothetical protein AAG906_040909 [Vitis piasezkii]